MKKSIGKFLILVFLVGFPVYFTDARSGCCSHHGGVCGCECCDGSSLSSTCAPYYPSCNRPVRSPLFPEITPKPTPTFTPISSSSYSPLISNTSDTPDTSEENNSDGWWTLGILGVLGYVYYKVKKK